MVGSGRSGGPRQTFLRSKYSAGKAAGLTGKQSLAAAKSATAASFLAGTNIVVPAIRGAVQAAQRFIQTPVGRASVAGGAAGAAGGIIGESFDSTAPMSRGGRARGVWLVDKSTGLNLGVISRKRALGVLSRRAKQPRHTRKFVVVPSGQCLTEVK